MTEQEIQVWLNKPVRATLADGRIFAGTLHVDEGHGHGHKHYLIVSPAVREGAQKTTEMFHGPEAFTTIEDASGDPAANENA